MESSPIRLLVIQSSGTCIEHTGEEGACDNERERREQRFHHIGGGVRWKEDVRRYRRVQRGLGAVAEVVREEERGLELLQQVVRLLERSRHLPAHTYKNVCRIGEQLRRDL